MNMYISLSVLSALAWATAIGTAGYFFGVTIEAI
jgi:membrane protein DedA with SNARE-associated domain